MAQDRVNFDYAEVHEILNCDSFKLTDFDLRLDTEFAFSQKFKIGPKGKKEEYAQLKGYHRYGLKVLGKYPDDKWLHPFGDDGNWYRAYHGTARAFKYMDKDGRTNEEMNRDAMANIYNNGFQMAYVHPYGPGVYCSPSIEYLEELGYIGNFGKFKFALEVCVDPENCTIVKRPPIYVAKTPAAVRPYGIIIK